MQFDFLAARRCGFNADIICYSGLALSSREIA
jgi:hypothetical protein